MGLHRLAHALLGTPPQLTDHDLERGTRLITVDGICSMAMASLQGGPFLTAFALGLGASNYEIGLLAAIGFLSQAVQLPALFLVRAFPYRRAITVRPPCPPGSSGSSSSSRPRCSWTAASA